MTLRIVLRATWEIVHGAVDLNRHPRAPNSEVDRVAADVVLAHNVNALVAQAAECLPSAVFARIHAAASFGCFMAR